MSKNAMHANPENDVILDDGLTPRHKMGRMHQQQGSQDPFGIVPIMPIIDRTDRLKPKPVQSWAHFRCMRPPPFRLPPSPSSLPGYGAKLPRSFSFTFSSQGLLPFPPFLPSSSRQRCPGSVESVRQTSAYKLACRSVLTQDDLPMFVHARAH